MLGDILNSLTDPASAEATLRDGLPTGLARPHRRGRRGRGRARSARWSPARCAICSTMAARTVARPDRRHVRIAAAWRGGGQPDHRARLPRSGARPHHPHCRMNRRRLNRKAMTSPVDEKPGQGHEAAGLTSARQIREFQTISAMLRMYCRAHHAPPRGSLCPDCGELHDYAQRRLERCVFGEAKPTCANCAVHCYKPAMREQVRQVMIWAGPRMLWRHPVLAAWHLIEGRRPAPKLTPRGTASVQKPREAAIPPAE